VNHSTARIQIAYIKPEIVIFIRIKVQHDKKKKRKKERKKRAKK